MSLSLVLLDGRGIKKEKIRDSPGSSIWSGIRSLLPNVHALGPIPRHTHSRIPSHRLNRLPYYPSTYCNS